MSGGDRTQNVHIRTLAHAERMLAVTPLPYLPDMDDWSELGDTAEEVGATIDALVRLLARLDALEEQVRRSRVMERSLAQWN